MAWLDSGLRQRIVGALVLVALAVIFLPMLLSREDARRDVQVEAPPMPVAPPMPDVALEPVEVPEPAPAPEAPEIVEAPGAVIAAPESARPSQPITSLPEAEPEPEAPVAVAPATPEDSHLDAAGLPVSWSIQLASLSNRANAEALVKRLRGAGYNGYLRTVDDMNRVFVGPLIERKEAERVRDQLQRQLQLKGFVVRFEPERR